MLGKLSRRLYHACWYAFAIVVLASAIMITLIRLMLPHVGNYRTELQDMITRQTGYMVSIENITGEWEGWVPVVRLDGINVSTMAAEANITRLKSAAIKFNPYAGFREGQFTPFRLTVSGLDFTVVRGDDGALNIGTGTADTSLPEASGPGAVPFMDWLFLQKTIALSDSRIRFVDTRKKSGPILLSNVDMVLKNGTAHMQLNGSTELPAAYGEKCSFALDLYGDLTTPHWSGHIYFDVMQARPDAWLSHTDADAFFTADDAPVDLRIWSAWQNARLDRFNGAFLAPRLHLTLGAATLDVQRVDALFAMDRDKDDSARLRIKIKEMQTGNGTWPVTEASILRQARTNGAQPRYIIHAGYLNLRDLDAIVTSAVTTEPRPGKGLVLSGTLQDSLIVYDPDKPPAERIAFDSGARGLTVDNGRGLHLRNMDGKLVGNMRRGVFSLDTQSLEITAPGLAQKTFTFNELQGDLRWNFRPDSLVLETPHLQAHTPHFNATLQGKIDFITGASLPFVDVRFGARDLDLENIRYYLPASLPQKTHAWIKQALVAGDVSSLDVILRGQLDEFPFDHNEGRIEAIAGVHNGTLDYHADWVPVDNIEAELRIDGRTLTVDANSGNIYKAIIAHARGTIADLGAHTATVEVQGAIKGQIKDVQNFIRNTPLSASHMLGTLTKQKIDGAFRLDLGLHIPLHDMPVTYNGDFHADDATLETAYGLNLDHITGNIAFTENTVTTTGLAADYFNEPVNLIIHNNNDGNGLRIGLEGNSGSRFIATQLARFFQSPSRLIEQIEELIEGNCDWQAVLFPPDNPAGAQPTDDRVLRISSPLAGLSLKLPAPLGKGRNLQLLEITTTISDAPRKHISFTYGDNLAGSIDLSRSETGMTLSRAELALGAGTALSGEGDGIRIHGTVNELPLVAWYRFLHGNGDHTFSLPVDNVLIDIMAGALGLSGQHYANTRLKLLRASPDWRLSLNGDNINGDIFIPAASPGVVRGTFTRLGFSRNEDEHSREEIDPGSLPPLQLTVDDFTYGSFNLGKLALNTSPGAGGMSIDKVSFTKPELEITGTGAWTSFNGSENSAFDLVLHADTMATMLTTFNYIMEPVKDGVSRFMLKAQWHGSPMDFSLAGLTGSLNMQIDKGQFLNLEPKAGRLFGLLNLQTLVRLMSLDLSVFFSKGYSFDKIDGSFTIESGNAYTNNLSIKGRTADIDITGRTGLVDKDYDQVATITPRTLFGPIGMGLGAVIFIAGEVFESIPEKIDEFLRYQYSIKGTWDEPIIEKIEGEH